MKKLFQTLLFLGFLLTLPLQADYIKNAIVVCSELEDIKAIEPHIEKNSNKHFFDRGCLILTSNAKISITKNINNRYLHIFVHDLNTTMYTLNKGIVLEKSTGQI